MKKSKKGKTKWSADKWDKMVKKRKGIKKHKKQSFCLADIINGSFNEAQFSKSN